MQKYDKSEAMKGLEWHFVAIGRNFLETWGMGSCWLTLFTESHVKSKLSPCYTALSQISGINE